MNCRDAAVVTGPEPGRRASRSFASCPLVRDGLVLHLESDWGVDRTGNKVVNWRDQSGQGNDLDLPSGNPTVGSFGPGDRLAIGFNGVTDRLRRFVGFLLHRQILQRAL